MTSAARFSDDRVYRYTLHRHLQQGVIPGLLPRSMPDGIRRGLYAIRAEGWEGWEYEELVCGFVMLNPSTADEERNDPTVRRCIDFATAWGFDRLVVLNLFAFRSTDPAGLREVDDPVGPENDQAIRAAVSGCAFVLAAWGVHGQLQDRDRAVVDLLRKAERPPYCLLTTRDGFPMHPLYVSGTTEPQPLEGPRYEKPLATPGG